MSKKYLAVLFFVTSTMFVTTVAHAQSLLVKSNHKGNAVMAIVNSISGSTLTVTVRGNNSAVTTVDASTAKIKVNGADSTVSGIKTADRIIVLGTIDGSSITATQIIDGAGDKGKAGRGTGMVTGVVSAVNSDGSIVITVAGHVGRAGKTVKTGASVGTTSTSETVSTDATTHFFVPGVKNATISGITVGTSVSVMGQPDANGNVIAKMITVRPVRSVKTKK